MQQPQQADDSTVNGTVTASSSPPLSGFSSFIEAELSHFSGPSWALHTINYQLLNQHIHNIQGYEDQQHQESNHQLLTAAHQEFLHVTQQEMEKVVFFIAELFQRCLNDLQQLELSKKYGYQRYAATDRQTATTTASTFTFTSTSTSASPSPASFTSSSSSSSSPSSSLFSSSSSSLISSSSLSLPVSVSLSFARVLLRTHHVNEVRLILTAGLFKKLIHQQNKPMIHKEQEEYQLCSTLLSIAYCVDHLRRYILLNTLIQRNIIKKYLTHTTYRDESSVHSVSIIQHHSLCDVDAVNALATHIATILESLQNHAIFELSDHRKQRLSLARMTCAICADHCDAAPILLVCNHLCCFTCLVKLTSEADCVSSYCGYCSHCRTEIDLSDIKVDSFLWQITLRERLSSSAATTTSNHHPHHKMISSSSTISSLTSPAKATAATASIVPSTHSPVRARIARRHSYSSHSHAFTSTASHSNNHHSDHHSHTVPHSATVSLPSAFHHVAPSAASASASSIVFASPISTAIALSSPLSSALNSFESESDSITFAKHTPYIPPSTSTASSSATTAPPHPPSATTAPPHPPSAVVPSTPPSFLAHSPVVIAPSKSPHKRRKQTSTQAIATSTGSGMSCHQCKTTKNQSSLRSCTTSARNGPSNRRCCKKFCITCLQRNYLLHVPPQSSSSSWRCPACELLCLCCQCLKKSSHQCHRYGLPAVKDEKMIHFVRQQYRLLQNQEQQVIDEGKCMSLPIDINGERKNQQTIGIHPLINDDDGDGDGDSNSLEAVDDEDDHEANRRVLDSEYSDVDEREHKHRRISIPTSTAALPFSLTHSPASASASISASASASISPSSFVYSTPNSLSPAIDAAFIQSLSVNQAQLAPHQHQHLHQQLCMNPAEQVFRGTESSSPSAPLPSFLPFTHYPSFIPSQHQHLHQQLPAVQSNNNSQIFPQSADGSLNLSNTIFSSHGSLSSNIAHNHHLPHPPHQYQHQHHQPNLVDMLSVEDADMLVLLIQAQSLMLEEERAKHDSAERQRQIEEQLQQIQQKFRQFRDQQQQQHYNHNHSLSFLPPPPPSQIMTQPSIPLPPPPQPHLPTTLNSAFIEQYSAQIPTIITNHHPHHEHQHPHHYHNHPSQVRMMRNQNQNQNTIITDHTRIRQQQPHALPLPLPPPQSSSSLPLSSDAHTDSLYFPSTSMDPSSQFH